MSIYADRNSHLHQTWSIDRMESVSGQIKWRFVEGAKKQVVRLVQMAFGMPTESGYLDEASKKRPPSSIHILWPAMLSDKH